MVTVPVTGLVTKDNTPPQLASYEPFFNMLKQDNIPVVRIKDAMKRDKQVIVIFDMEQFQTGANTRLLTDAEMSAPPLPTESATANTMGLAELLSQTAPAPPPAAVAEDVQPEVTE